MKTSSFKYSILAGFTLMLATLTAQAGPHGNADFPVIIKDKAAAEKIAVGTKVAMACDGCKTVEVKTVDAGKSFLAWFKPDSKHDCTGCGGKLTLRPNASGKGSSVSDYTHVCSKCGDSSAYTCAAHSVRAK